MILTIDGRRIGYDDSGGSGVPLVLLHGFPLDRTVWDEQLGALAGTRVIRIDLRGCGESEPDSGPALMESLAGDVAGVLDALHAERAALVGHSIGGYVALAFFRMYAERVAGLALVASHVAEDAGHNPGADPAQRELAASRDALAVRLELDGTMDAAVESYLPRYFAPHVYRDRPDLVERARALMQKQNPPGCAQLVRGMKERLDSHDLLEDIGSPGARDRRRRGQLSQTRDAARDRRGDSRRGVRAARKRRPPPNVGSAGQKTADALALFAQRVSV